MKKVLLIIGLVVSAIMFLVMLWAVLFESLDGAPSLPLFGGLCYVFARRLIYSDKEIGSHIGWVLIINGITLATVPIWLPSLGVFSVTEVLVCVLLLGSGVALVVRSRRMKAIR